VRLISGMGFSMSTGTMACTRQGFPLSHLRCRFIFKITSAVDYAPETGDELGF